MTLQGLPHDVVQVAAGFAHSYILAGAIIAHTLSAHTADWRCHAASGDLYTVGWGEHAQLGFHLHGSP